MLKQLCDKASGLVKTLSERIPLLRLLEKRPVRYFISSCIAFAVDYLLLLALERLFSGWTLAMEAAATIAFLCSSQINFHINRLWVFKSEKSVIAQMGGYYGLAAVSFVVKTFVIMELLVRALGAPTWIAKPVAEAVMFVFNYIVQKTLIFRKNRAASESDENKTSQDGKTNINI